MSEYWVSKKKYYCQYCEIYIADDAPSRSQHENGLRHKGNKDRFIRSLYKAGVKKKIESEEEKREMKRVEQAAQEAYARDVGAGLASSSSSSSTPGLPAVTPAPKPRIPPPKPSDPYANYTTAASLGISDPDVDRLIEEAKVRQSEGRAGDWVTVAPPPPPLPLPQAGDDAAASSSTWNVKSEQDDSVGGVRKRVEEPIDEDDTRRFKMRKKTAAVGLGEIYDPGFIRVKPRVERPIEVESTTISVGTSKLAVANGPVLGGDFLQGNSRSEIRDTLPEATERPSWTRREWKRAGEESLAPGEISSTACLRQEDPSLDEEKKGDVPSDTSGNEVKKQDACTGDPSPTRNEKVKEEKMDSKPISVESLTGSLFRKRKVPVGSNTGRGRRHV